MRARALEQLFIRPRGGGLELLLVLENAAGARFRETLPMPQLPRHDAARALSHAAKHLARRGDIEDVSRVRVRVQRGDALEDDDALKRLFIDAFTRETQREPHP